MSASAPEAVPLPCRPIPAAGGYAGGKPHSPLPGSGSREVLLRVMEERNFQLSDFRHIVEISDLHVIKELVKAGCGVTFPLPQGGGAGLEAGALRLVPWPISTWPTSLPSSGGRTASLKRSSASCSALREEPS